MHLIQMVQELGYQDHIKWVRVVADKIDSTFEVLLEREPTREELRQALGDFLMEMVEAQEEE